MYVLYFREPVCEVSVQHKRFVSAVWVIASAFGAIYMVNCRLLQLPVAVTRFFVFLPSFRSVLPLSCRHVVFSFRC